MTTVTEPVALTPLPDPYTEIRITSLGSTRGANYWSRAPITRLDLLVGAYDEISSAEVDGFTERLVAALPGLEAHRCSIGELGGFITRLHRGTYVPHIVEHVALELQSMIGHDVGYGRSRGGDVEGEYTVTFEHRHESVGQRAAALALEIVQQGLHGGAVSAAHAVAELEALAKTPDVPPVSARVRCGVTGGSRRAELRQEIAQRAGEHELIVDVSPSFLLQAGLPYAESEVAVVVDTELTDVPERYRDAERASRLMCVAADGVLAGGTVVVPAKSWEIQDYARSRGCGVAIFSGANDITRRDRRVARSMAWVTNDEIVVEHHGRRRAVESRSADVAPAVQAAAALAAFTLAERRGEPQAAEEGARVA